MRYKGRFAAIVFVIVAGFRGSVDAGEPEPPAVAQARELIRDNGRSVAYFALPTYAYDSTGYNDYRRLDDGYELTFTFVCKSFWRTNTTRMAFYFDRAGHFDFCKVLSSSTHYTPFTDAVGKKELKKLRAFLAEHPAVRDSRVLTRQCEESDAKALCELFLKLEEAKRGAGTAPQPQARKEPLSAAFEQVAPVPKRATEWVRSTDQKRAVVLIHGYRPEYDRFLTARAVIQDWQESDSLMVQVLVRDADVFAFFYGQNVPVQEVSEAPELANGITRLRKMGYTQVVLVGHSAGGLVCRHFVEDHRGAGVTKVVQVCSPNGGSFWAKFTAGVCSTQKPYVASLTADSRHQCQLCRDNRTIPDGVEFLCVVGDAVVKTDWVVPCTSQWTDDLQAQGIPAIRLKISHLAVVHDTDSILAIARAVREPAPRWDRKQVQVARQAILKD